MAMHISAAKLHWKPALAMEIHRALEKPEQEM
jgi:hypothetical protein